MDTVQDSWVNVYTALHSFKGPDGFASWASRITRNTALMKIRKDTRIQFQSDDEIEKQLDSKFQDQDPSERVSSMQLEAVIEESVDKLPEKYRSVFVLRAVQQLDTQETADSLEISTDAVKQRYSRSRKLLQEELLSRFEQQQLNLWMFAGDRCDLVVRNVMQRIEADS